MRDEHALLTDMLIAARKIQNFTQMTWEEFENHEMAQSAVIREFQVVGEAARQIQTETRALYPQIPWKSISGMRNTLIHEYFAVRLKIVWQTAKNDIPPLISELENILGN